MGIDSVATGHYASVRQKEDGSFGLYCGKDEKKDQSYFLWKLTQRQLSRLIFPLAGRKKEEILLLAEPYVSRSVKESMEICFIPQGDTQTFLEQRGGKTPEGDFVDCRGRVLGRHRGIFRYTVGQRRGLGVAMGERYFVTRLLPETGRVELGPEAELYTDRFPVEALRGLSGRLRDLPEELLFRGRHRGKRIPCRLVRSGRSGTVYLSEPIRRIAPGQSACFYLGEELVCGGVISEEKGPAEHEKRLCAKRRIL